MKSLLIRIVFVDEKAFFPEISVYIEKENVNWIISKVILPIMRACIAAKLPRRGVTEVVGAYFLVFEGVIFVAIS